MVSKFPGKEEKTMKKSMSTTKIVFIAMLAALVYVVTLFRFPLLGSKVHLGNAVCLLSGLLIPKLHHNGAAIALVVSELTVNGLLLKYALSIAKPRLNLRYWASLLGSGAVMTAAVAALQRLIASPAVSLAVSVAVGVAVYFLSAWILKNETLLAFVSRLRGKKTANMQDVPVDEPEVS